MIKTLIFLLTWTKTYNICDVKLFILKDYCASTVVVLRFRCGVFVLRVNYEICSYNKNFFCNIWPKLLGPRLVLYLKASHALFLNWHWFLFNYFFVHLVCQDGMCFVCLRISYKFTPPPHSSLECLSYELHTFHSQPHVFFLTLWKTHWDHLVMPVCAWE